IVTVGVGEGIGIWGAVETAVAVGMAVLVGDGAAVANSTAVGVCFGVAEGVGVGGGRLPDVAVGGGVGVTVADSTVGVAVTLMAVGDGAEGSAGSTSGSPVASGAASTMAVFETVMSPLPGFEASASGSEVPEQPNAARVSRTDAISHIRICLGVTDTLRQGFH
ncbi:MAG: hypothetical protein IIC22_07980, partial [Chloroflexi bacterium]|nr:hypothetical protein [Chloroflexota bacterium]